jgi:hypothetical protein
LPGRADGRLMFHDHELVLDYGVPGGCPRVRSSVIWRRIMIMDLRAGARLV